MSKLIFIIDSISTQACQTPTKIANLYMNRFSIDENAAFEVIAAESFSATEDHLEPNFVGTRLSDEDIIDDLAIKTLDNFEKSTSLIEETLKKANLFEKNLNLSSKFKTNIHLIYCGNPFNWISGSPSEELQPTSLARIIEKISIFDLRISLNQLTP